MFKFSKCAAIELLEVRLLPNVIVSPLCGVEFISSSKFVTSISVQ